VKTQVSSIYRKLGVSRRAQASAVAQHLQLLYCSVPHRQSEQLEQPGSPNLDG